MNRRKGLLLSHALEAVAMPTKRKRLLALIGPAILVAATGVGAGDLATASFTGSMLGLTILWAVVLGAFLKFVLNEGLARWQLATGDTLLEGCVEHFGRPVQWLFVGYLVVWSFLVAAALMSAVGVTSLAIYAPWGTNSANKIFYGVLHSAAAVLLIRLGGYRLFEKVMGVCIALMFVTVVLTAVALRPSIAEVLAGLVWPAIPAVAGGVTWTVALIGGVGGTLTILCYGYWIREEGRRSVEDLKTCRVDFKTMMKTYAVVGALCIPMLAFILLVLNGRAKWVGSRQKNSIWTSLVLTGTLLFFVFAGWLAIRDKWFAPAPPQPNASAVAVELSESRH
jgi:Mn2+/Fe2+ NRAMP family transporter